MPAKRRRQASHRSTDVAYRLHSAVLHLMRRIRREDEATGLSAPRVSALACVVFGGPRTLTELAYMEQVSMPTMSALVAGLEEEGCVRREGSGQDKRVTFVHATTKGKRIMLRDQARRAAFLADRLIALPAHDLDTLDRAARLMLKLYKESRPPDKSI